MAIVVRIPTPLQKFTKNQSEVSAYGATIADILDNLEEHFPGLRERLVDERGSICLLYTSPSPRDRQKSRMPSSA